MANGIPYGHVAAAAADQYGHTDGLGCSTCTLHACMATHAPPLPWVNQS